MLSTKGFLLLLSLALGSAVKVEIPKLEVPKIQRLQQQSETLSAQNPSNAPICFDYYRPKLDGVSQTYEDQYTSCTDQYAQQVALEDAKWEQPRKQLVESGENACGLMTDCSTIVGLVEAFECYAEVGAEQSKTMYTISASATEYHVAIKDYYNAMRTTQTVCINNAERAYVEDTASTYEDLNNCLSGKLPVTTTPIPTTRGTTTTEPWVSTAFN